MNARKFFRMTRNRRRGQHKTRRASKRSRRTISRSRKQRGGDYGFHIPPSAVVGRTNEEGVQEFKRMKEVLDEKET